MKLEKTREAIAELEVRRRDAMSGGSTIGAIEELADAESLLREAAALKERVKELEDAVRNQAAQMLEVQQSHEGIRNAALEEAESAIAARSLSTHNEDRRRAFEDAAEVVAALKRGG